MVVGFPICTISLSCSINEIHGGPLFLKDHNFFYFGKYTLDQIVDAFTSCSQSEFWLKLCMWNVFNKVVHMVLGNVQGIETIKASTMGRCPTRPHHFCGYNLNWLQMCMGHPCWQCMGLEMFQKRTGSVFTWSCGLWIALALEHLKCGQKVDKNWKYDFQKCNQCVEYQPKSMTSMRFLFAHASVLILYTSSKW